MLPEMKGVLDAVCKQVDETYGKGTVTKLTTEVKPEPGEVIGTSSIALDTALGIGGYKKGKIVEIFGSEASGKTTLCLHAVANAQALGKECLYIDAEQSLDPNYAESLGVDLNRMFLVQPDYGEQALDVVNMFAKSGEIGLVIVDSVSALVPKSEIEGTMEDHPVGTQARMMSQALRMLTAVCNKSGTTVIFVNQIRYKIGVMFGNPETVSGGNALKFYASQRLDIRRVTDNKSGDHTVGHKCKVKVVKNKLAPPKKIVEFDIIFGKGIDSDGELVKLASQDGIIKKSGAWFKYADENIQGKQGVLLWLNENPDIKEKIQKEILINRGLGDFDE